MSHSTPAFHPGVRRNTRGVALIIVLAFVVLLTGLVVAYFSRAMSDRQISTSSAAQTKVQLFAQGAANTIIDDLKQEMAAGSSPTATPANSTTNVYYPTAATMVPYRVGVASNPALVNLVKRSASGQAFFQSSATAPYPQIAGYPASNRASAVASSSASLNGRFVTAARWNKPLFLPATSATDQTPLASSGFVVPDWILVTRNGNNLSGATTLPLSAISRGNKYTGNATNDGGVVIGRYAYNIYDEGGLLDVNVAGYPSNSAVNHSAYKPALSYADLTQIFLNPAGTALVPNAQKYSDQLVVWRNYASTQSSGAFPSFTLGNETNYYNYVMENTTGFLRTANTSLSGGQSDHLFASRQQLISFLTSLSTIPADQADLQNSLQYLTTFSRDLNQPSYIPAVQTSASAPTVLAATAGGTQANGQDKQINPSYLAVRVQKTFTRNDGSTANVGNPLVNRRFALNRLAWLTCKGPSQPRASSNDADIVALKNDGMSQAWLEEGTDDNIAKYFGLRWNGSQWLYNIHNGNGSGIGSIMRVGRPPSDTPDPNTYVEDLAQGRDPDFFELLKSAITVGSLGKSLVNGPNAVTADNGSPSSSEQPYNYNYDPERSVDRQIIQIGANMINQSRPDNFPVQIVFNDGVGNRNASATASTATTVVGVADIPYLYYIFNGVLQVRAPSVLPRSRVGSVYTGTIGSGIDGNSGYQAGDTAGLANSGVGAVMQIPALWNPNDPASPRGVDGPKNFRIVADSTTPDQVGTANYSKFFAYSASVGTTVGSGPNTNSYNGTGPNSSWYRSASQTGSEIAHSITASNNEIDFTANSGTAQLFPEPTMLLRAATINDSNGNAVTVKLGGTPLMSTDPAVSAFFSNGGLPNYIADATRFSTLNGVAPYPTTTPYLGFYLGAFPWAWNYPNGTIPLSGAQSGAYLGRVTGGVGGSLNACYLTYRVQCQDAFGNWMTYDTKYGKVCDGNLAPGNIGNSGANNPQGALLPGPSEKGFWATVTDPRTSRFGIHWNGTQASNGVNNATSTGANGGLMASVNQIYQGGWLDYTNGILKTNRPDAQSGFYFMACWRNAGMPTATSGWMAWICNNSGPNSFYPGLAPGLLSQNNPDIYYSPSRTYGDGQGANTHVPNYFADPDGIVRRGMGAFVPIGLANSPSTPSGDGRTASADTTVGLPVARVFAVRAPQSPFGAPTVSPTTTNYTPGSTLSQAQSRPYFLHRPFRSVAELGCVFSDTPWRNLDFFTSESGNTALLDVFCISDTDNPSGLVAGKVNLNTRQQPVLKAILTGAYLDPANISMGVATSVMSATTADKVASALTTYINNNGSLQNLAELVGKWKTNKAIIHPTVTGDNQTPLAAPFYDGKLSYVGFSGGQWDSTNHKPLVTNPAADVYSAYMSTADFGTNARHNGTRETATYIQRIREAPIRALTAGGQTRVWNLMIDVVAQTGRYPQSANTLANFVVEGEQRYWVHVAIDRYTGQVLDKQIEVVKE